MMAPLAQLETACAAALSKPDMAELVRPVFAQVEDFAAPRIKLSRRVDLRNLPPTTSILGQFDPLRPEGIDDRAALSAIDNRKEPQ